MRSGIVGRASSQSIARRVTLPPSPKRSGEDDAVARALAAKACAASPGGLDTWAAAQSACRLPATDSSRGAIV